MLVTLQSSVLLTYKTVPAFSLTPSTNVTHRLRSATVLALSPIETRESSLSSAPLTPHPLTEISHRTAAGYQWQLHQKLLVHVQVRRLLDLRRGLASCKSEQVQRPRLLPASKGTKGCSKKRWQRNTQKLQAARSKSDLCIRQPSQHALILQNFCIR